MITEKFEKKGKFNFIKTWVFPKEFNEWIPEVMKQLQTEEKSYCHVFCGESKFGGLRIDTEPELKPDLVADCLDLPEILGENSQANVIADFPWQIGYGDRRKFSYALRDICKEGGYLLLNCPWSPWVTGLEIVDVVKVAQNFNSYRDLVDWWIMKKIPKKKTTKEDHRFSLTIRDFDKDGAEELKENILALAKIGTIPFDIESEIVKVVRYK